MTMSKLWIKALFRIRERANTLLVGNFRKAFWTVQGMQVGKGTTLPHLIVSWPHQVRLGERCRIEHGVYFHYDGIYQPGPSIVFGDNCFIGSNCEFNISSKLQVGSNCLIASGTVFIDHNHGIKRGVLIGQQECTDGEITLGDDVWIGANVVVLAGVTLGEGVVVGAGAVVTKSVPPYTIVAGVPARAVKMRE